MSPSPPDIDRRLRDELARPLPGDVEAERRAWSVIGAAAPTGPVPPRRLPPRRTIAVLASTAAAIALALTPPGIAVSNWIREGIGVRETVYRSTSPALRALPGGGELLVHSGSGTWIVSSDGSRRRVGPYRAASWSPNGLFVAAVAGGRQLVAVSPRGEIRWALTAPRGVRQPRWSPSGLRIAYRSGRSVRVVSGAGSGDMRLLAAAGASAPAWRPSEGDELAVADEHGRVTVLSAVTGRILWQSAAGPAATALSWSGDGTRLAVSSPGSIRVFAADGSPLATHRPGPAVRFGAIAYAPRDRRLAALVHGRTGSSVRLLGRSGPKTAITTPTALGDLAWSPNGRWLLATYPSADQWLFLHGRRPHRVIAKSDIAAQLNPASTSVAASRIEGWCCAGSAGGRSR